MFVSDAMERENLAGLRSLKGFCSSKLPLFVFLGRFDDNLDVLGGDGDGPDLRDSDGEGDTEPFKVVGVAGRDSGE